MMQITYQITFEDWLDGQRTYMRSRASYKFLWVAGSACLLSGVALIFLKTAPAIFLLVAGIYFVSYPLWVFPLRTRRAFRRRSGLNGPMVLNTTQEGLTVKGDNIQSECKWALFTEFKETKRTFMIHMSDANALVVPKGAFASSELAEFRRLLGERVRAG